MTKIAVDKAAAAQRPKERVRAGSGSNLPFRGRNRRGDRGGRRAEGGRSIFTRITLRKVNDCGMGGSYPLPGRAGQPGQPAHGPEENAYASFLILFDRSSQNPTP